MIYILRVINFFVKLIIKAENVNYIVFLFHPTPSPPLINFCKTLIGHNSVNSLWIFEIPTVFSILIAWSLHLNNNIYKILNN